MGIDFHAVSIERSLFDKYVGTRKLESLFWLGDTSLMHLELTAVDAAARERLLAGLRPELRQVVRERRFTDARLVDVDIAAFDDLARHHLFQALESYLREVYAEEPDDAIRMRHFRELFESGELPSDDFGMGKEWRDLIATFDRPGMPSILQKAYTTYENAIDEEGEISALWGSDLRQLASALAAIDVAFEEYDEDLADGFLSLKAYYQRAADRGWVVMRGLF